MPDCGQDADLPIRIPTHRSDILSLGARPGPKPGLAWFRDGSDYEGVPTVLVVVLVGAGAAIWWQVSHENWGLFRRMVFWVVLVAVLWVLVNWYSVPHPEV
jgi:hypothetical protein